jgi:hypothetical protein
MIQANERFHIIRRRCSESPEDRYTYDAQLTPINNNSGIKLRPTKKPQHGVNDFLADFTDINMIIK